MHVVDWQDSPLPVTPKRRRQRHFLSPTLMGILGTLLLHTLIIPSLALVGREPKAKPPEMEKSVDAQANLKNGASGNLVLITLPIANFMQAPTQNFVASLPDLSKIKIKSPISADPPEFRNFETLALSEDQASNPMGNGADGAEQARLLGIYTGQIQARIDRVWRRPRTPVNEVTESAAPADSGATFQCEAQIVQDAAGNVQEILLPRCNGSASWRRSLVMAIQQASPLPAPPSAKVFSRSIVLNFIGIPYIAGSPVDEYELEPRAVARSN